MTLTEKADRQSWEASFASAYIAPVLQRPDLLLKDANAAITNDNRLCK